MDKQNESGLDESSRIVQRKVAEITRLKGVIATIAVFRITAAIILIAIAFLWAYDNKKSSEDYGVITIILVCTYVGLLILRFCVVNQMKKVNETAESDLFRLEQRGEEQTKKREKSSQSIVGEIKLRLALESVKSVTNASDGYDYVLGKDNENSLYVVEKKYYSNSSNDESQFRFEKILFDDIQFFSKEGDIQYTTQVSGGGARGGGSSLKAVIGGLVAGGAGAIIGSRKKVQVDEIRTVEHKHDSRVTIIRYKKNGMLKEKKYTGFDAYEFLLESFPEKDLTNMQVSSNGNTESLKQSKNTENSVEERLTRIKDLYEKGLLEEEDYQKKKEEIMALL